MSDTTGKEDCVRELAQALVRFQFIEEGIKSYLERAYLLTRHAAKGKLTIRFSPKHLQRMTLKPLLAEFNRFNSNDKLIQDISGLVDKRNHLAHGAFREMYERMADGEDLLRYRSDVMETAQQAGKCVELLLEEIRLVEKLCVKEGIFKTTLQKAPPSSSPLSAK